MCNLSNFQYTMEELELIIASAKQEMDAAIKHLDHAFQKIRAGRASTAMVQDVMVEYYGAMTPLSQVANVSIPDAMTISIQPWDKNAIGAIEKAIIVYWSSTGNTEAMANVIAEGVKAAGGTPELVFVDSVNVDELLAQPAFAIGCPAMGAEELDESVESFVSEIEGKVSGKNILLFGSYDWGDGEWMRLWVERMQNAGANIIGGEGIIANLEPDDDAKAALEAAGKQLAAF